MLGLPDAITTCLFDLDGVLTKTATVHAAAWKQMFDDYLRDQGDERPFDVHDDYDTYVDGKPRSAGVRDFLASRGMHPSDEEIARLGDIKNDLVLELIGFIEERYEVQIADEEVLPENLDSIACIIRFVGEKTAASNGAG